MTLTGQDQQLALPGQAGRILPHKIGIRSRKHHQLGSAELVYLLCHVTLARVDVMVRPELHGKLPLRIAGGHGDYPESHFASILNPEMAQASDALDDDRLSRPDVLVAYRVEDGQAGAEKGRGLDRVGIFRQLDGSLAPKVAVFGDSSFA